MKNFYKYLISICVIFLCGCGSRAEDVMPPLQYKQPIEFHVQKNAYLNWEVGKQYSSTLPQSSVAAGSTAGFIGVLIANAIESEERSHNPGRYTFNYGKAQQAVFMTSLKDTLEQNRIFNNVQLTTESDRIRPQDILITVYFKMTRVASAYENYKVILDADLIIKSNKQVKFKRNYFVESNSGGAFSTKTYKEQQMEASQQLLGKIIAGIQQWYQQS